jgi:hypothetical protein
VTNQSQTAANPTSSASRSFTVSTAAAPPTMRLLSVSKTGSGNGTVTSNPAGINCGADCSQSYTAGTVVTLAATPAAGSSFSGWSGACSGTSSCSVTMSESRSVTAAFDLVPDTTPPNTTITGGPSGETTDNTPTFAFGSDEANSTFVCQIDQALPEACTSPHTTQPLGTGTHTFAVYARDAAGNQDPTPATRQFTVPDTIAPAIANFRLSPSVFRAARSGPALSALVGTRISVSLSEAATVTFRVTRLVAGRWVRQRGRIVRELAPGTTRLRYRGRLAGRTLAPGRYRLLVRARDAAGNLSSRRRASFLIVR